MSKSLEEFVTTENAIKAYEADWDEEVILGILGKPVSKENLELFSTSIEWLIGKLDEAYLDYITEL